MHYNPAILDNFTKALNYYISVSGKTKREVAIAIQVPPTTFSSWCNGKHLPDMDKLQVLSSYFKVPITQFFEFTLSATPPDPLLQELAEIYTQLPNEDKLLVRAVALRLLQLHTKK